MNWCWVDGGVNYEISKAGHVRYPNIVCIEQITKRRRLLQGSGRKCLSKDFTSETKTHKAQIRALILMDFDQCLS